MNSFLHLSTSLENLVKQLRDEKYEFPISKAVNLHEILRQKGIYLYKRVDSIEKFSQKELPPIEAFHNDLSREKCSEKDYKRAQEVWRVLECETFKDYHDAYLMADVVLLAEVIENYRKKSLSIYQVHPIHFITAPSFVYFNFLKYLNESIEVLSDEERFDFFMQAKRGGVCSIGEKNFSNVYQRPGYIIIGLDMTSLYPCAMRFPLPIGEYEWVSEDEGYYALYSSEYDWKNSNIEYYLEVDLICPEDLRDKFSAYPLFPEKRDGKLMGTLYPKEHYIFHIMNLRFGLKLGYKILKIHRVLRFRQEPFMREYIDHLANERRKYPKGTFLNEFYKGMMNQNFGKTCENPYKYRKFKFVRGHEKALKLFNTKKVKNFHCIDKINNVVLMEMRKNKALYNRPLPIGVTILEISKWYIVRFQKGPILEWAVFYTKPDILSPYGYLDIQI
jgi:hypothetical protein